VAGADDPRKGPGASGEVSGAAARLDPHAILESVPEPVGLVDRDGRILAFNAAGRRVIRVVRSQEVSIGDDLYSFISPHNQPGVRQSLERAFAGEAHAHRTEARGHHFETVYSPVRGEDGDVVAVSIRVADVTAREHAVAALTDLNASLEQRVEERTREIRSILASTYDGFALFGEGGRFVEVNESYCRMLGYTREELLGMSIHEVDAVMSREEIEALAERLARVGSLSFETRHRRKDGSVVDVETTLNWEKPGQGPSFAFVRDITARKEAEAIRNRQLEILGALPDLVGMADESGRLLYLNPAGRRLLGLERIDGRRVAELHPAWFAETHLREIGRTARSGRVWRGESVLCAADGREIPVRQVVVPHVRPDGSIPYFSTIARDVSEERQVAAEREERAAELARLNAELERAARAKDAFLASMSHELRTPLTGILGATELLRTGVQGPLTERQARSLGYVEDAGRHLLALLADILDLAKIGAERLSLSIDACMLGEICDSAVAMVRGETRRKGIALSLHAPPAPVRFLADGRRVRQMLVNLLSNAVKFTPAGGSVALAAAADEEKHLLRFEVRDTGSGIAAEDLPKLFQPFTQLDTRLSREHAGTGLGLALVRSLADLHGGRVEVESTPGRGSLFRVVLPWSRPTSLPGSTRRPPGAGAFRGDTEVAGKPRVLLVEDDDANRTILGEFLATRGFDVDEAATGMEALELAAACAHDLVVLDIQLPGMDGLEVLSRLGSCPRGKPPVLALTALAMSGDRERILAAGADAYLSKPAPLAVLGRELDRLLALGRGKPPAPRATPEEAP
jgi:PAS domain S-box-containing protein